MMCQSINLLDLNVLDVAFFTTMQALQQRETPKTIDGLVVVVEKFY